MSIAGRFLCSYISTWREFFSYLQEIWEYKGVITSRRYAFIGSLWAPALTISFFSGFYMLYSSILYLKDTQPSLFDISGSLFKFEHLCCKHAETTIDNFYDMEHLYGVDLLCGLQLENELQELQELAIFDNGNCAVIWNPTLQPIEIESNDITTEEQSSLFCKSVTKSIRNRKRSIKVFYNDYKCPEKNHLEVHQKLEQEQEEKQEQDQKQKESGGSTDNTVEYLESIKRCDTHSASLDGWLSLILQHHLDMRRGKDYWCSMPDA